MEIQGYEDYLIYEDGRVYSKRKKIFMKHSINNKGYLRICMCINYKRKWFYIHRLIAIHYIPNPDNKPEVDHIDINPLNNSISNLRWATRREQNLNKKPFSNTGEKYISKSKSNKYKIAKRNCFCESLNCSKYTLEDAINLRDALLSIEDNIV